MLPFSSFHFSVFAYPKLSREQRLIGCVSSRGDLNAKTCAAAINKQCQLLSINILMREHHLRETHVCHEQIQFLSLFFTVKRWLCL